MSRRAVLAFCLVFTFGAIAATAQVVRLSPAAGDSPLLAFAMGFLLVAASVAGLVTATVLVVRYGFLPSVLRRRVLRKAHPDAVVFTAYDRVALSEGSDVVWRPFGRFGLTMAVVVNDSGWSLWRGILRPRRGAEFATGRIRDVRESKDPWGEPAVLLILDGPEETLVFSLVGERPSPFRRVSPDEARLVALQAGALR